MTNKYAGIVAEKNGTFTVKTTLKFKDGYIKYITKRGFLTKTEALNYKLQITDEINNTYHDIYNNKDLELHNFFDMYLEEYSLTYKLSSKLALKREIDNYMKATLPNKPMSQLKPTYFKTFRDYIANQNLSSKYSNIIINHLVAILKSAIDKCYLNNDLGRLCILELKPIAKDSKPSQNDYWEYDEFKAFINTFENDDKYKLLFLCLFTLGCRMGEFRGLKFKDINFHTNQLHICRQVTSKLGQGKWVELAYTKTNRDRYTTIPSSLAQKLLKHKTDNNFDDDDFIFFGSNPISENAINSMKKKHCEIAKVKCIRNHDFRHSYITYLLDNNLDIKVVAEQVGHTDVTTTLNIYNHISKKRNDKLKSVLDDMFLD